MDITSFDLQKLMVRAYQDPGVIAVFMEMLYDYLNNTSGAIKISYVDGNKYIDVTTNKTDSLKFTAAIKDLYGKFVLTVINEPTLEFLLSKDSNYRSIKSLKDWDLFYCAAGAITVLDISNENEKSIFRINLIN